MHMEVEAEAQEEVVVALEELVEPLLLVLVVTVVYQQYKVLAREIH